MKAKRSHKNYLKAGSNKNLSKNNMKVIET